MVTTILFTQKTRKSTHRTVEILRYKQVQGRLQQTDKQTNVNSKVLLKTGHQFIHQRCIKSEGLSLDMNKIRLQ